MKVRFTEYRKDAAAYHPVRTTENEVDPDVFQQYVKIFGFAITNRCRPDCYWKITSYNTAEMLQVLED